MSFNRFPPQCATHESWLSLQTYQVVLDVEMAMRVHMPFFFLAVWMDKWHKTACTFADTTHATATRSSATSSDAPGRLQARRPRPTSTHDPRARHSSGATAHWWMRSGSGWARRRTTSDVRSASRASAERSHSSKPDERGVGGEPTLRDCTQTAVGRAKFNLSRRTELKTFNSQVNSIARFSE